MKANIFPLIILTYIHLSYVRGLVIESYDGFDGPRVFNGDYVRPWDYLYTVQLQPTYRAICGGAIISNFFILTAGHCVADQVCKSIKVFPSTYNPGERQTIFVDKCFLHNGYVPKKFFEDLGVLKTQQNLVDHMRLRIIPLPPPNKNYPENTPAIVIGWGQMADGTFPDQPVIGTMRIQDWKVCNFEYKHAASCTSGGSCPMSEVSPGTLCTIGHGTHPASACEGDSGGPLIINGYLAGIIIAAITVEGKCVVGSPNLHVSVVHYRAWIDQYV